ncbi:MAG: D-tyrosyl-tRNA(Tyr) deacylase [Flavobacteriaceae bacterium]|nr:D-tyrosyl-tRNA(Tyr) deacylase [Flavobacteriaceae bacterium]
MRVVVQRVSQASVSVDEAVIGSINKGLLVLLGVTHDDTMEDVDWLVRKVVQMRIFDDSDGVMNSSLLDVGGDLVVVSQFTLHALTKKGNRPSYVHAANHQIAVPLYEAFVQKAEIILGKPVSTGEFGAMMKIDLINDGPVTIMVDSKKRE